MRPTSIIAVIGFLAIAALLIVSIFAYSFSDCFNCDPVGSFNASISEWKSYSPKQDTDDVIAGNCESMISWMNDTLTVQEEAEMLLLVNKAIRKGEGLEHVQYLWNVQPVDGDEKNALEWIFYKRNEQEYEFRVSFVMLMKKFLSSGNLMVKTPSFPRIYDYYDKEDIALNWEDAVLLDSDTQTEDLIKYYKFKIDNLETPLSEEVSYYGFAHLTPKEASDTLIYPAVTNQFIRYLLRNQWYHSPTVKQYSRTNQQKRISEARQIYGIQSGDML